MRLDMVNDLVALIGALTLPGTPTVGTWKGEADAFNDQAAFPTVWVHYLGADMGPDQEAGAHTYTRVFRLAVLVATRDVGAVDGYGRALAILDALEEGLGGQPLQGLPLELEGDNLVDGTPVANLGRYLYAQTYKADDLHTL